MNFFQKLFHKHIWFPTGRTVTGATLSWGITPTREFTYHYFCQHPDCRGERDVLGQIAFMDKYIYPEFYNKKGWPIDEQGNKLPISGGKL